MVSVLWGCSEGAPLTAVILGTILLPLSYKLTLESRGLGLHSNSATHLSAPPFPSLNRTQWFLLFQALWETRGLSSQ